MKRLIALQFILLATALSSLAFDVDNPAVATPAVDAIPAPSKLLKPAREMKNVRVCYYGKIINATIPADDPRIVELSADKFYPPNIKESDTRSVVNVGIVPLKWYTMLPLERYIGTEMQRLAMPTVTKPGDQVQYPWWLSMYEAGLCLFQERLKADNDYVYEFRNTRKVSAESVHFVVKPPTEEFGVPDDAFKAITKYTAEFNLNIPTIKMLKQGYAWYQYSPWMAPGLEARNRQVSTTIGQAYLYLGKHM